MKTVLSYLNPINVINRVRTTSLEQRQMDSQYETFNFEFVSNEYMPIYDMYQKVEEKEYYDVKLGDIDDIYMNSYDKLKQVQEQETKLMDYIVQDDDTLFGLELKFRIGQNRILQINDISADCLIPGMKIKVPFMESEQNVIEQVEPIIPSSYFGRNLMDEIMAKGFTKKFHVYYVANIGHIEGALTINQDIVLFDPNLNQSNQDLAKAQNKQTILLFQACIMTEDIISVDLVQLPTRISKMQSRTFKDYLVQMRLACNPRSHKQLSKQDSIHLNVQPIVTFRIVTDDMQVQFYEQSQELYEAITDVVKTKSEKQLDEVQYKDHDLTVIPFYDRESDALLQQLIHRCNGIWGGQDFIPQLLDPSNTVTNDEFLQVISHIPSMFKTCNWKLIYSNNLHGSSYQTMLSNSEDICPLILIVKDMKDCRFGAYINEYPKLTYAKFYGNGETFLWTLKNQQFMAYNWTQVNNDFIYCETDGFAVGCGDKYGLYINHSMQYGSSNKCDTFSNEVLSSKPDFEIQTIEIWGLSEQ